MASVKGGSHPQWEVRKPIKWVPASGLIASDVYVWRETDSKPHPAYFSFKNTHMDENLTRFSEVAYVKSNRIKNNASLVMGSDVTAPSLREDTGADSHIYPPFDHLDPISFTSLYFYQYELQYTQFEINFSTTLRGCWIQLCMWLEVSPSVLKTMEYAEKSQKHRARTPDAESWDE